MHYYYTICLDRITRRFPEPGVGLEVKKKIKRTKQNFANLIKTYQLDGFANEIK